MMDRIAAAAAVNNGEFYRSLIWNVPGKSPSTRPINGNKFVIAALFDHGDILTTMVDFLCQLKMT